MTNDSCPFHASPERHLPILAHCGSKAEYRGFRIERGAIGEYLIRDRANWVHVAKCMAEAKSWIDENDTQA